jgi:hypothetical protein
MVADCRPARGVYPGPDLEWFYVATIEALGEARSRGLRTGMCVSVRLLL